MVASPSSTTGEFRQKVFFARRRGESNVDGQLQATFFEVDRSCDTGKGVEEAVARIDSYRAACPWNP